MPASKRPHDPPFPGAAAIAALRARLQGIPAASAVHHYLPERIRRGSAASQVLREIRRDLGQYARVRGREDLGALVNRLAEGRSTAVPQLDHALELIRDLPSLPPQIGDDVERWLPERAAKAMRDHGIKTLAELTLRIPRDRIWWRSIPGLGQATAAAVERFFASNPELTERARALVRSDAVSDVVPLEQFVPPPHLDGSDGRNRPGLETCLLSARNDCEAIHAWLSLHEASSTHRSYRKEAERVLLWATVQLGKPFSSLTTEDGVAYRAFLRDPAPRARWVGPHRNRSDPRWRPFAGKLTAQSAAYGLTVVSSLCRWLVDQQYLRANPFAGVKVRGAAKSRSVDVSRSFTDAEWTLVRTIANDLDRHHGWAEKAAHRARFLLDFGFATGLRPGELIAAGLAQVGQDEAGDWWLSLVGKGAKPGRVAVPPLAHSALLQYLHCRHLPCDAAHWNPHTPLVANLVSGAGISATRLWAVMCRLFETLASVCETFQPPQHVLAAKLRCASTHWMRHTHASHALANGAELVCVRDNLRHASISTTSLYLHAEDVKRARQIGAAFS